MADSPSVADSTQDSTRRRFFRRNDKATDAASASLLYAIVSPLLGLGSFAGGILVGCGVGSALAVVLGIYSLRRIKASEGVVPGRGRAIAGIVLGAAYLVLVLVILGEVIARGSWGVSVPSVPTHSGPVHSMSPTSLPPGVFGNSAPGCSNAQLDLYAIPVGFGAAGSAYGAFEIDNVGPSACTLIGFSQIR